jgi:OOP family OmpA-OmpF porin
LANLVYADKTIGTLTADEKATHAQAIIPTLFLTIHNELGVEEKSVSEVPAAVSVAAPKDTDKDGVIDEDDKCPGTPAGVVVNSIGCSEKEKASVKLNVEFASGKSLIDSKYQSEVQNLANFMSKFPTTKVEIAGHSDTTGNAKANTTLSQARAEAVKQALVQAGVSESRVTAKGYGPTQPIADNKTKEGRTANRRVMAEISIEADKKK